MDEAEEKKLKKLEEVQNALCVYKILMSKVSKMSCNPKIHPNDWQQHLHRCDKCILKKKADDMKVPIYEEPLPSDKLLQEMIAFEMLMPKSVAQLRDALFLLESNVLHTLLLDLKPKRPILALWTDYAEIANKKESLAQKLITL